MANDNSLKIDIAVTWYRDGDGRYNLLSYDVNIPKEQEAIGNEEVKKETKMKALEILKQERDHCQFITNDEIILQKYDEAIQEIENLQNENKSLVKTLEKYNEEMIELRKQNQDLLNSII